MGKVTTINGYTFEKTSSSEYLITSPNGSTQVKHYLAAENLMKQLQRQQNCNLPKSEVYNPTQKEYHKLKSFAEALNAFQDKMLFDVQICPKDYGQGIMWTTILAQRKSDGMSYMFLTPAKQTQLLESSYTEFSKLISSTLSEIKKG